MSLRDFLDKHPLAILTTVATAAVSTGAGVAGYLTTQRCEIDTATLELKHSSEVELLSAQIRSIERRVGDGSAYFDVTSLVIPSQKVSSLPKQYQSLEDGRIFVSVPDDPKWTFSETNELAVAKTQIEGGFAARMLDIVGAALAKSPLLLWRSSDTITVNTRPAPGMEGSLPERFNFFPLVAVQFVDEAKFTELGATVSESMHKDDAETEATLASLSRRLDEINRTFTEPNLTPSPTPSERSIGSATASNPQPENGDKSKARAETEKMLAKIFRGDLAGYFLGVISQQITGLAQGFEGATGTLISAQKKGNVLYIQSELAFTGVIVKGVTGKKTVYLNQEFFIIATPAELLFVKIQVPSLDRRSTAFLWVRQWLAGLRIPLET